ncbi:MAG: hypothetical protein WC851_00165 [Candidatus Shapirobacteria bacterium]|jgi:hypothetical protein
MTLSKDTIQRSCSRPPASGVGARTIEDCGHPIQKYLPPSEHCIACITASMRGGQAVDVPASRNSQPIPQK